MVFDLQHNSVAWDYKPQVCLFKNDNKIWLKKLQM
jgi:hypothetical protein